jgi:bifunctional UDP-N-acetylglucosamine pyrophosphorylase/glucosamine-1-phosphate N-acetyltransferase
VSLSIVILAAGSGSRMKSNIPKVLHPLGGTPMLERIIKTAQELKPKSIHVVYGFGGETVLKAMAHLNVCWVYQAEQLGTGHAVSQVIPELDAGDQLVVLFGDVPLISSKTLFRLIDQTPQNGLGLVISELDDPSGFGRIIRNDTGNIIGIVEHKDANPQELAIREINTGIMTGSVKHFKDWLPRLKANNIQKEYYLTDVVSLAVKDGFYVGAIKAPFDEVRGVNDRWQLAQVETLYQHNLAKELALAGVTILDFNRISIRGDVQIAKDVTLDVNIVLEGPVSVGENSYIGPNTIIKNAVIGKNCILEGNCVIKDKTIADGTVIIS